MKQLEMTVLRAIQVVDAFDKLDENHTPGWPIPKQDWRDVPMATYRKIFGDAKGREFMLETLWDRYKDGSLQRNTIELAANLDMDLMTKKRRKEIEDGLSRLDKN
jgi:hypothetical protein